MLSLPLSAAIGCDGSNLHLHQHHPLAPEPHSDRGKHRGKGDHRLFQPDLDLSLGHVDATDVSQHLPLGVCLLLQLVHVGVVLAELGQELVAGLGLLEGFRNEGLDGEAGRGVDAQAGQPGEDCQLAGDVQTVEILPWVRFLRAET